MDRFRIFLVSMFAVIIAALASASTLANPDYGDPYSGVNCVGCYYQYTNTIQYSQGATFGGHYYDYIAPPRAGGWFGSGSEWLVGLRAPVYTPVPPVRYTNYYQPVVGVPAYYGGGWGYPRMTASQFPAYRGRLGGVFSY